MFYGIRNGKVFIISEEKQKVKVEKWLESEIVDGVYENGKIVEKENSETYKKQQEELKQKQIQEIIKELQEQGYNVDDEGNIIKDEKYLEVEIQKINKLFDSKVEEYTKSYPHYEKLTWETKRVEAEKVLAGQSSEYLNDLVKARLKNISDEDLQTEVNKLANKIIEKGKAFAKAYAQLEAEKKKQIQELKESLENNSENNEQ